MTKTTKPMSDKIILDLCAGTGAWSKPYRDAGYDVQLITLPEFDITEYLIQQYCIALKPYGILFATPCTVWANSGARWWWGREFKEVANDMMVLSAGLRIIAKSNPIFFVIENPVGKLNKILGSPIMKFNPCDYSDAYTKKTLLWGKFKIPEPNRVKAAEGSKMHLLAPSEDRQKLRGITPPRFAQAFYNANK